MHATLEGRMGARMQWSSHHALSRHAGVHPGATPLEGLGRPSLKGLGVCVRVCVRVPSHRNFKVSLF